MASEDFLQINWQRLVKKQKQKQRTLRLSLTMQSAWLVLIEVDFSIGSEKENF